MINFYAKGQTLHYIITSADKMVSRVCLTVQHHLVPYTRLCSVCSGLIFVFVASQQAFSELPKPLFLSGAKRETIHKKGFWLSLSLHFKSGSFCNSEMAYQADPDNFVVYVATSSLIEVNL